MSLKGFLEQRKQLKRKAQEAEGAVPKNPKLNIEDNPVISNLQSQVSAVDIKLNLLLSRFPAPPETPEVPAPINPTPEVPKKLRLISLKGLYLKSPKSQNIFLKNLIRGLIQDQEPLCM